MSHMQPQIPTFGFLRLPQVLAIVPISKSAWWEGCRTGRYPKPIKLGSRTTVWRVEDITDFVQNLGKQADEAKSSKGVKHE